VGNDVSRATWRSNLHIGKRYRHVTSGAGVVGSKGAMGAAKRIVSEMPAHELYIEAFAGGGAVGRLKKPAGLDLFIERDPTTAATLAAAIGARGTVVCGDCTRVLMPEAVPGEAVLYADPPYLMSVRRSRKKYYRFELSTDAQHERFLAWVDRFRCRVMVSGYWSELYAARLPGWRLITFGVPTRKGRAIECLWCNFDEPRDRHDTRYVGAGYRERERIQRKVRRWVAKLAALPLAERAAVLSAFGETGSAVAPAGPPVPSIQAPLVKTAEQVPQMVLL
jgi:DNA adenine methylase